ncbi:MULTISPECIES: tetratricopeptide repeat protein [Anaerolinea]|jgi:tetratricopeptide (TPR) repeat protein|uniref:tetratricopeptide repeat protein n=1 Tax=Anaerolinea TaxID=233189 RepID=UPI00261838FF|nr:tetratricopeptide repeat protein [Anaerolinea thermophila]
MAKPGNQPVTPTPESMNPTTPAEFLKRGWLYYARGDYKAAEEDFRRALESNADDPEALYALGLNLLAAGRAQDAVSVFEKAFQTAGKIEDHVRASMIQRLIKGHINRIRTGNWNLDR